MPQKKKGKNTKSKGSNIEKRKLIEADLDGQVYGILEKALGSRFFTVNCLDNMKRRCKVRQKRMKCNEGDCVIISLRDFDDQNADIIYKYDDSEFRQLQKMGVLPDSNAIGSNKDPELDELDEVGFDFDDI